MVSFAQEYFTCLVRCIKHCRNVHVIYVLHLGVCGKSRMCTVKNTLNRLFISITE